MKKFVFCMTLVFSLLLGGCAAPSNSNQGNPTQQSTPVQSPTENNGDSQNNLDALGSIEVEKELFDVTLIIPKDFVGEQTQDDLDVVCAEKGFKSITLNEDGSVTYVMTKSQHKELMTEYRDQINGSLAEMVGSEDYPNVTDIQATDDFTAYTVKTTSTELTMSESFMVMAFYMYSGMYSVFSGDEIDNVSVTFINSDSGEIIQTANSKDMND